MNDDLKSTDFKYRTNINTRTNNEFDKLPSHPSKPAPALHQNSTWNKRWVRSRPAPMGAHNRDSAMNFGDLKRFEPFCAKWGKGSGEAIDRFFMPF